MLILANEDNEILVKQELMARMKYGILGPLVGKIANLVAYLRFNQAILRSNPKKPKKKKVRSNAQKAVNLRFRVVKQFISSIDEFINVGYQFDVIGTTRIPENGACSYLLREAVIGQYPDFKIDFSKVMVSRGKLPAPVNAAVKLEENVFKFTWDVDPSWGYQLNRDQVMILAYKPANQLANQILSGARRNDGAEELKVILQPTTNSNFVKDEYIETYIAFISDDRKRISDSVYVGRVTV